MVYGRIRSSIVEESVGKSSTDHLFKDGSRIEEGADAHRSGIYARIHGLVRMIGPLLGFDPFEPLLGFLSGDAGLKIMVPIKHYSLLPYLRH